MYGLAKDYGTQLRIRRIVNEACTLYQHGYVDQKESHYVPDETITYSKTVSVY